MGDHPRKVQNSTDKPDEKNNTLHRINYKIETRLMSPIKYSIIRTCDDFYIRELTQGCM